MIPQKKNRKQLLSTPRLHQKVKNALWTPKRQLCLSNLSKQGTSGSQDQKERKTAGTVTTIFFGKKNHHSANSLLQRSLTQET